MVCKYLLLFHRLPFYFVISFALQKLFSLMQVHLLIFAFVAFAFGVKRLLACSLVAAGAHHKLVYSRRGRPAMGVRLEAGRCTAGDGQVHSWRGWLQVIPVAQASDRGQGQIQAHKQLSDPGYWHTCLLLPGLATSTFTAVEASDKSQACKCLHSTSEAGCSQEEGPRKGFVMGSRTRGVQEILEKCI